MTSPTRIRRQTLASGYSGGSSSTLQVFAPGGMGGVLTIGSSPPHGDQHQPPFLPTLPTIAFRS